MAMLMMMRKGTYENQDAVEKVIRYVTRTRKNENRADELIAWGGMGVGCYASPEMAIGQFCYVQDIYGMRANGKRKIFHEVFSIGEEFDQMWRDYDLVYQIAMKCAEGYYSMGYQVVFAIHHTQKEQQNGNKGVHIHFVVNTVSFLTGKKWHSNFRQSYTREKNFNQIMKDRVCEKVIEPLYFTDFSGLG